MSLVSGLLPALRVIRSIPGTIGTRPTTASVTVRTNDGEHGLEGNPTEQTFPIEEANGQPPKIEELKDDEIAMGVAGAGSYRILNMTPDSVIGGGLTFDELIAKGVDSRIRYYTLTNPSFPNGQKFELVGSSATSSLHFTITLQPMGN